MPEFNGKTKIQLFHKNSHCVVCLVCEIQKLFNKSTRVLLLSLSEVKPVRVFSWKHNAPFPLHLKSKGRKIRFSHTGIFSVKDEFSKLLKSKFPEISEAGLGQPSQVSEAEVDQNTNYPELMCTSCEWPRAFWD